MASHCALPLCHSPGVSCSYKAPVLLDQGPTPMTSSNVSHLFQGRTSKHRQILREHNSVHKRLLSQFVKSIFMPQTSATALKVIYATWVPTSPSSALCCNIHLLQAPHKLFPPDAVNIRHNRSQTKLVPLLVKDVFCSPVVASANGLIWFEPSLTLHTSLHS